MVENWFIESFYILLEIYVWYISRWNIRKVNWRKLFLNKLTLWTFSDQNFATINNINDCQQRMKETNSLCITNLNTSKMRITAVTQKFSSYTVMHCLLPCQNRVKKHIFLEK